MTHVESARITHAVDAPNASQPDGEWVNHGYFTSREEAIAYAREEFGADEEGRISLVSAMPDEDGEGES